MPILPFIVIHSGSTLAGAAIMWFLTHRVEVVIAFVLAYVNSAVILYWFQRREYRDYQAMLKRQSGGFKGYADYLKRERQEERERQKDAAALAELDRILRL